MEICYTAFCSNHSNFLTLGPSRILSIKQLILGDDKN
jgi:hypothetical protein